VAGRQQCGTPPHQLLAGVEEGLSTPEKQQQVISIKDLNVMALEFKGVITLQLLTVCIFQIIL